MAFTASSGPGDALTGLINLLANPDDAMAQLQALKDATTVNEKAMIAVGEAQAALDVRRGAFELELAVFAQEQKALADKMAAVEAAKEMADRKIAEAAKAKAILQGQQRDLAEEKAQVLADLKVKQNELEEHRKNLAQAKTELDKKSLALNVRETELNGREVSLNELMDDYKAKLSKLKSLVD